MRIPHHLKRAIYIIAGIIVGDQLSKWWLLNDVMRPPHAVAVTPFLNLVLVHNQGVTFGMLGSVHREFMPYILMGIAGLIVLCLMRWLILTKSPPVAVGLAMVVGGAVSNVMDRIREGAVIDFLDFYYRDYHWYAFNLADAAIVTGVSLLLLDSLIRAR